MSLKLPTGNLQRVDESQLINIDRMIRSQSHDNGDTGYILNADLIVPKTKKFENYPLAPETKK